ncbi:MAG: cell division protein SepF [SAR202 cluster bacterium]|jgi:SepF-like predicted cell division protein (DUF552 family)|nr:cell division protein SepF [SAR202 cluster bacterium]|tara:strand:- start:223 stop:633 length:411 start_codon:yes stop_codon:yes gene_type:complete
MFKDLFDKLRGPAQSESITVDDFVELNIPSTDSNVQTKGMSVKVCKLKGFSDVDIIVQELSVNNMVVLDIKPLAERSMNELRHAIAEVKDICLSMDGDIIGLSEYHLIITPPSIKIDRNADSRAKNFEETIEKIGK